MCWSLGQRYQGHLCNLAARTLACRRRPSLTSSRRPHLPTTATPFTPVVDELDGEQGSAADSEEREVVKEWQHEECSLERIRLASHCPCGRTKLRK
jgi:hypothetical protein